MNVILNSDVIFGKQVRRTDLPHHVSQFLQKLVGTDHVLVIPETTALEFESKQAKARTDLIAQLTAGQELLAQFGIAVAEFDAESLVPNNTLETLLSRVDGLHFAIVKASIDDYHLALRKACLREPPHPPEGSSDEMRDLVIWQLALRMATERGAILLSRDAVHVHHRGDLDAQQAGLLRTPDFDRALEILNLETASGALIRTLLASQWEALRDIGLPLSPGAHVIYIRDPIFETLESGTTLGTFQIRIADGNGSEFECDGRVEFTEGHLISAQFHYEGSTHVMTFNGSDVVGLEYQERLSALKASIGGHDEH